VCAGISAVTIKTGKEERERERKREKEEKRDTHTQKRPAD